MTVAETYLMKFTPFKTIIPELSIAVFEKQASVFHELVAGIVFQQISYKAAENIHNRFVDMIGGKLYTVDDLIKVSDEEMIACGLSNQKRRYMKNIAHFFNDNRLESTDWDTLSNEEIHDLLIQIKGVGEWTIQMLLLFYLERPDIFPVKDLGVQIAMKKIFGLTEEKKLLEAKMVEIAEPWKPYRSIATKYLWAWKRVN